MQTLNNQTFTCVGINNTISVIRSKRFRVEKILIIKNSKAEKNRKLNNALMSVNKSFIKKIDNRILSSRFKTQGVSIKFSGSLVLEEITDYEGYNDSCLLILDRVEDPQKFGQIIRTAECAGIEGIIFSKHHSVPLNETVLKSAKVLLLI